MAGTPGAAERSEALVCAGWRRCLFFLSNGRMLCVRIRVANEGKRLSEMGRELPVTPKT